MLIKQNNLDLKIIVINGIQIDVVDDEFILDWELDQLRIEAEERRGPVREEVEKVLKETGVFECLDEIKVEDFYFTRKDDALIDDPWMT